MLRTPTKRFLELTRSRSNASQTLFPDKVVLNVGNLSFGVCHGHQVLPHASKPAIEDLRRYRLSLPLPPPPSLHWSSPERKSTAVLSHVPHLFFLPREMGVDVLITGNTHKLDIWQGRDGGLYINPGSVSWRASFAVYSKRVRPSFTCYLRATSSRLTRRTRRQLGPTRRPTSWFTRRALCSWTSKGARSSPTRTCSTER